VCIGKEVFKLSGEQLDLLSPDQIQQLPEVVEILCIVEIKGTEEMVTREMVQMIDRLREAAKEHGAVYDLLLTLDQAVLLDDAGNQEWVGDESDVDVVKAAQICAVFAEMDREP